MKQALLYTRKNHLITTSADGSTKYFSSIGKAKRESRKLQLANGGLGRGSLVIA